MKIYEVDFAIAEAIANGTDPETGVISEEALRVIEELNMDRDKKIDSMLCAWKNQQAEMIAIKAEIESLTKRYKTLEKRNDSFKEFIYMILGGTPFTSARNKVTFIKGREAVEVNEEECPKKYMKLSYSPDKTAIKELLKAGKKIKGCQIVIGKPTMKIG